MTKIKMALALDKLIKDVKEEKILWNENHTHTAEEEESAWNRVASKNMLTGGEAKSIFKVLCKKYRQEAQKPLSSWQLFESLKFLDEKHEETSIKNEVSDQPATSPASNHDEETFVELLEVKDEEFSDDETTITSTKDKSVEDIKANITLLNSEINCRTILKASNEKQNQQQSQKEHNNSTNHHHHHNSNAEKNHHHHHHQQKSRSSSPHRSLNAAATKKEKESHTAPLLTALKRKYSSENNHNNHQNNINQKSDSSSDDVKHDLPDKRRLLKMPPSNSQSLLNSQQKQQQHQQQQQQHQPIHDLIKNNNDLKIVAVPKDIAEAASAITNNKTSTMATTSNNNSSNGEANSTSSTENDTECRKYSSFGSYVATTMNRLTPKLAAKLEIKILQAIIDVNSEMMNRF